MENNYKSIVSKLFLAIVLLSFISAFGQKAKVVPFQWEGKWGLVDTLGVEVLKPTYQQMENFSFQRYYFYDEDKLSPTIYNAQTGEIEILQGKIVEFEDRTGILVNQKDSSYLIRHPWNKIIHFDKALKEIDRKLLFDTYYFETKDKKDILYLYSWEEKPRLLIFNYRNYTGIKEIYDKEGKPVGFAVDYGEKLPEPKPIKKIKSNQSHKGIKIVEKKEISKPIMVEDSYSKYSKNDIYSLYDLDFKLLGKSVVTEEKLKSIFNKEVDLIAERKHYPNQGIRNFSEYYKGNNYSYSYGEFKDKNGENVFNSKYYYKETRFYPNIISIEKGNNEFYFDTTGEYFKSDFIALPTQYLEK